SNVETILNECTGRSWNVLNAGQSGTGTVLQEQRLYRLASKINFDFAVLFYFVGNDPYDNKREQEAKDGTYTKADVSRLRQLKAFTYSHFALDRFLHLRLAT